MLAGDALFVEHARTDLPLALRALAMAQGEIERLHAEMLSDRGMYEAQIANLRNRLTAKGPAHAVDASEEARVQEAWEVFGDTAHKTGSEAAAWLAVVRAVDASRPAPPTPEEDDEEPLTRGARVRTVTHLTALFSPSLHPHRRPNADGKIVRRMTSGDIYYDVRHDDGTVAGYERSELIDLTADVSRPGLTEEQATDLRERAALIAETCSGGDHTITNRDLIAQRIRALPLRAARGEVGPAPAGEERPAKPCPAFFGLAGSVYGAQPGDRCDACRRTRAEHGASQ